MPINITNGRNCMVLIITTLLGVMYLIPLEVMWIKETSIINWMILICIGWRLMCYQEQCRNEWTYIDKSTTTNCWFPSDQPSNQYHWIHRAILNCIKNKCNNEMKCEMDSNRLVNLFSVGSYGIHIVRSLLGSPLRRIFYLESMKVDIHECSACNEIN